jgi:AcrR family transcriptional regulator
VRRRKPKTSYHHGNLRAALIQCGLELIERKGIHALTLREIGKQLGVSRSAAYRHFKDKAALLTAISEAGFVEFGNIVEAARKDAGEGFAAQMDAIALAYAHFADEHRAEFEVMFAAVLEPGGAAEAGGGRNLRILEETIRKAQQAGEVRQGDPALLARVIWALVHGASMLRIDAGSAESPFIRFSTEALRSGLSNVQMPSVSPPADQKAEYENAYPQRCNASRIATLSMSTGRQSVKRSGPIRLPVRTKAGWIPQAAGSLAWVHSSPLRGNSSAAALAGRLSLAGRNVNICEQRPRALFDPNGAHITALVLVLHVPSRSKPLLRDPPDIFCADSPCTKQDGEGKCQLHAETVHAPLPKKGLFQPH